MKAKLEYSDRIGSTPIRGMLPIIIFTFVFIFLPLKTDGAGVTLAWDPNIEEDLDGYVLYYGIDSGIYTEAVDIGNLTEYTLTGLEEDVVYYFSVTAYDIYGNESDFSDELSHAISGNRVSVDNNQDDANEDDLVDTGGSTRGGCFICSITQSAMSQNGLK